MLVFAAACLLLGVCLGRMFTAYVLLPTSMLIASAGLIVWTGGHASLLDAAVGAGLMIASVEVGYVIGVVLPRARRDGAIAYAPEATRAAPVRASLRPVATKVK